MAITTTQTPGGIRVGNGRWGVFFDARITLGNIIVIAGILIASVLWYARVDAHIGNDDIHASLAQRQAVIRQEIALAIAPVVTELGGVTKQQTQILDELREIRKEQRESKH